MKTKKTRRRIPDFRSDREAAAFWDRHSPEDFEEELETASNVYSERPRKQVVTLRLDRPLLQRLRALAVRKGIPYSTLIRMWLRERCEKESVAS